MNPIAEVLSSSIIGLVAESWQQEAQDGLPAAIRPDFGSFVRVESEDDLNIYAVVFNVVTGPQDNMHKPSALKLTREQLKVEQPHIFALLKTEVHAAVVGYSRKGEYFQQLPPQPAQVHDFVYRATDDELRHATADLGFMRLLTGVSSVPADELIAAAIRHAAATHKDNYDFLVRSGQYLTHLFGDDYDRLSSVLRKIKTA